MYIFFYRKGREEHKVDYLYILSVFSAPFVNFAVKLESQHIQCFHLFFGKNEYNIIVS